MYVCVYRYVIIHVYVIIIDPVLFIYAFIYNSFSELYLEAIVLL